MSDSESSLPKARTALRDLEGALARIEAALARRPHSSTLEAQLKDAHADYARLDAAARTVQTGLDGAILKLRTVLEG